MPETVLQTLMGALGSLGFALVFNVRGRRLVFALLGGAVGWGVYCLAGLWLSQEALRYLIATTALTLYAEGMARVLHCPSTILLVTGWIPLIPGGSLYYSISSLVSGNLSEFTDRTLHTMLLMIAMSAGVLLAMTLRRIWHFPAHKRNSAKKAARKNLTTHTCSKN